MSEIMPHRNIPVKHDYSHQDFAPPRQEAYPAHMKIKEPRKAKGLSQGELAEMIGTTQPTISKMEAGDAGCTIGLYRAYADAVGVTLSDLFADDRSAAELALIKTFRTLSPDRQAGWLEMARLVQSAPE